MMNQNLDTILNTISIFSNIGICTLDADFIPDNISSYSSCPKPLTDAYIHFFTEVFFKYCLEENSICFLDTDFNTQFYLIQSTNLEKKYILGPFLTESYKEKELKEIIFKRFGTEDTRSYINYYRTLPVITKIQCRRLEDLLKDATSLKLLHSQPEQLTIPEGISLIDPITAYRAGIAQDLSQRYRIENGVLDCIRFGTPDLLKNLGDYVLHKTEFPNGTDRLRSMKNLTLSGNTLFRKAAEQGGVPPILLDRTSRDFAIKIEQLRSIDALENLQYEMIFAYCKLVQQEKLSGYSAPIRAVINYIQAHLETPLTVDELAEHIHRNPKYLSSTFKREVGVGITEYINSTRVHQSLTLLRNTDLIISHISMLVGFNDANYFTKVFSKEMGSTPSQYRKEHST